MPGFDWRGRNPRGELVTGHVEAEASDAVATQLMNSGITPIEIREGAPATDRLAAWRRSLGANKPTADDLILFSRQMYTLTKAGVPLIRGLSGLAGSTRNPVLKEAIEETVEALESGRELSAALAQHPKVFSSMYVNLVRIGENTGDLEHSFNQMSEYLELDRDIRARVKAAMRYPIMVVAAIFIAISILMVWVIPVFARFFEQHDAELPLPTKIIMGASQFTTDWWWLILGGLVAGVFALRAWVRTETGRFRWDRAKFRIPVIGGILHEATMARFARAFAMVYRAGVPLVHGLTLVSRAVENEYVGQAVRDMRTGVERGDSLARTAGAAGLFSPLVLQMLNVGEETGDVDSMLQETAEFYEREVDYDLKNLSAYIEPILLIFMAVLVFVLALGVFLPMWDLGSAALG